MYSNRVATQNAKLVSVLKMCMYSASNSKFVLLNSDGDVSIHSKIKLLQQAAGLLFITLDVVCGSWSESKSLSSNIHYSRYPVERLGL